MVGWFVSLLAQLSGQLSSKFFIWYYPFQWQRHKVSNFISPFEKSELSVIRFYACFYVDRESSVG